MCRCSLLGVWHFKCRRREAVHQNYPILGSNTYGTYRRSLTASNAILEGTGRVHPATLAESGTRRFVRCTAPVQLLLYQFLVDRRVGVRPAGLAHRGTWTLLSTNADPNLGSCPVATEWVQVKPYLLIKAPGPKAVVITSTC